MASERTDLELGESGRVDAFDPTEKADPAGQVGEALEVGLEAGSAGGIGACDGEHGAHGRGW